MTAIEINKLFTTSRGSRKFSESRYRELIEAEAAVRTGMWSGPRWRHLELQGAQLHDTSREGEPL